MDNKRKEAQKRYYESHKEELLAKARKRRMENYDECIMRERRWREENIEKVREYQREYQRKYRALGKENKEE